MNQRIINVFNDFQIADLDDDMVGICKTLVDFMKEIRRQIPDEEYPEAEPPHNFYKMQPHQPKMELRKNYRKLLANTVRNQHSIVSHNIKLLNLYVVLLTAAYVYHLPVEKMVELSKNVDGEFTRKESEQLLLDDTMSPNWLKEPSGKDFTAIML